MNRILWHVTACATALILFPTSSRGAQVPAASFDELRRVLRAGTEVEVTGTDGRRTRGKYLTVDASSLEIVTPRRLWRKPNEKSFIETAVTTVKRVDSTWEGALVGFAAIYVPSILAACHSKDGPCDLVVVLLGPISGLLGASVGAFIDSRHNKTIYRVGTPAAGGVTMALSPLLTRKSAGASLNLRF